MAGGDLVIEIPKYTISRCRRGTGPAVEEMRNGPMTRYPLWQKPNLRSIRRPMDHGAGGGASGYSSVILSAVAGKVLGIQAAWSGQDYACLTTSWN